MDRVRELLPAILTAALIFAAVLTFVGSGLLRFTNPVDLYGFGGLVGLTAAVFYLSAHMVSLPNEASWMLQGKVGFVISALTLAGALYSLHRIDTDASASSLANDHRCLAIQNDMLSERPRRADSANLFEALGCRPQGEGGVHAPPTEAMRMVHDWLAWGGIAKDLTIEAGT